ncbi:MAG: aminodeoxychorismate/anthranilate synthase component II [Candidatus Accumulibacter sp.]|nr:aminodeoxychorismate/anthranilate synthase component II [Accumulibacter sp.]
MPRSHILMIDNFDSFSFNLVDALSRLDATVDVYRNNIGADEALCIAAKNDSALIVLSPGPGKPVDAGCTIPLIRKAAGRFPLFGVCLGHQAIAEAFGGEVGPANEIVHGKKSLLRHDRHPLFDGLPGVFDAGRYHSLVVHRLLEAFEVVARCDGLIMAIAHRTMPVYGVQFHPESILTTHGQTIIQNVLALARAAKQPGAQNAG